MRVTCDTNVLVRAAVRPAGPARAVFVALMSPSHALVLSTGMLDEVAEVLRYERVRRQAKLTDAEIQEFVDSLRDTADFVDCADPIPAVTTDPDDDLIVATAVHGKVEVICTRDRHLTNRLVRAYCATFGIRILTDVELLAELRAIERGRQKP
jgi:putative PIN family toxin of toxin-antitoxin system